jgi:phosphoribosylaminoimidazole-succinocarboxamide synthase
MLPTISQTDFPDLRLRARGKVRDIYDLDAERLLIVATDRLSAFDVVLPTPIPDKGAVLTQLSSFWFQKLADIVPNHVITSTKFDGELARYADTLRGRSMVARRTEPLPVECVVRGYIAGSGWKDYKKNGGICGIPLPPGLQESDRLPEAIFTPSTKATSGHDENISFQQTIALLGRDLAERVKNVSLEIYYRAAEHAAQRGIIIADTKFELGVLDKELIWIDEALTPDSSRFWPADQYSPGSAQPSFDKQFVRDYLERVGWNKQAPGPELPAEVVAGTRQKYREAYQRLTGKPLD